MRGHPPLGNPAVGVARRRTQEESPSLNGVEPTADFFVSSPTAGHYGRGVGLRIVVRLQLGRAGRHYITNASGRGDGREGKQILAFQNDTDRRRKTDQSQQPQGDEAPRGRKKRGGSPEVGQALRAAYQQAVSETIPPEMLDLLGKLG